MAFGFLEVGGDHFGAHFFDGDFRDPAELFFGFGRVAEQGFDFGGAEVAGIDLDDDVADFGSGCFFGIGGKRKRVASAE